MRRKTLCLSIAAFFVGVVVSLAGLDATPLLNASFESVEGGGELPAWGYGGVIDDWYENEYPGEPSCFWELGANISLVGDGLVWAGNESGGRFYQDIGTVDDDVVYQISALIGHRSGYTFDRVSFSLYASTADAATNALDGVRLRSFATLISTINVTEADGTPTGDPGVSTVAVNLATYTGHAGEVLWLEVGSVVGKDYIDNISIATSAAATPPAPVWTNTVFAASTGFMSIPYSDTLANRAVDAAGDAITYAVTDGNSWLTVAPGGALGGTPDVLGLNSFTVTASDGTGTTSATLEINVVTNTPPEWIEPVVGDTAYVDALYAATLAGKATDPDGEQALTFSLLETNTWLTVNANGTMQGTPIITDAGTNTFTVTVSDGADSSTTTLTLVVGLNNQNTIAFNFSENWWSKEVMGDGILYGTDQWTDSVNNDAPGGYTIASSAGDTNAVTTPINAPGVTVAWSSPNMWNAGDADTILENQLFKMYLDDGGSGITITVSGLSSWLTDLGADGYQVVFYQNSDAADNTFGSWDIDDGILQETTPPNPYGWFRKRRRIPSG